MPDKAIRRITQTIREIDPIQRSARALDTAGEAIIRHTPEPVRKAGRQVRRVVERHLPGASRAVKRTVRRAARSVRRATSRR